MEIKIDDDDLEKVRGGDGHVRKLRGCKNCGAFYNTTEYSECPYCSENAEKRNDGLK